MPANKNKRYIKEQEEEETNNLNEHLKDDEGYSTPKESTSISTNNSSDDSIKTSKTPSKIKKQKSNKNNTENKNNNYDNTNEANDNAATIKKVSNDLEDLESMFQNTDTDINTVSSNNSAKLTIVDIMRIYIPNPITGPTLVGFTSSNMYGGRFYYTDTMNAPFRLMYFTYINSLLNDANFTKIKTDVPYLFHKNNRPINLVTYLPKVENKYYAEPFDETLKKLVTFFDGRPDPSNEGKLFKINYMPDFFLDTVERRKPFVYLCKKMVLPDRLTLMHQAIMDQNGELPNY